MAKLQMEMEIKMTLQLSQHATETSSLFCEAKASSNNKQPLLPSVSTDMAFPSNHKDQEPDREHSCTSTRAQ